MCVCLPCDLRRVPSACVMRGSHSSALVLQIRVDGELRRHLGQAETTVSDTILMDITRIALFESRSEFLDVFFSLVAILFQQYASERSVPTQAENARTTEVYAVRRLIQALLSLIISSDLDLLQRCSAKMLSASPGFSTRAERRSFYLNEMRELLVLSHIRTRATLDEDQSDTSSRLERAFLDAYQPVILDMLNTLAMNTAGNSDSSEYQHTKSSLAVCHSDEALEQLFAASEACPSGTRGNEASTSQDALTLMIASYAAMCSHLRIPRVCVNLEHALAIACLRPHKRLKIDQLACYITNASQCRLFQVLPIATSSAPAPRLAMESTLELARRSRTLESLVNFCATSASPLTHECLKQVCVSQAKLLLNSKDMLFETRMGVSRQFELIHLQICEECISEMLGLLRELPLVLELKHSMLGAEANASDAFGSSKAAIEQCFELYSKSIMTDMDALSQHPTIEDADKMTAKRNNNRFWKHSSREVRVRARCLRLKTRVLWHLRQLATTGEQGLHQLFERIFLIDFLSSRCGNSEEAKLVAKFIGKAQDAVSCNPWQLDRRAIGDDHQSFTRSSPPPPSHPRRDKIIRSVALTVWVIWVRERCAYCLRSIELLQGHDRATRTEFVNDAERLRVGSLAATCALQLNALGVLVGKSDDIFALQISLLEESAKLNREKTVAVICWAFPADKVQARYLKRYKALRQTLKADASEPRATETATIEETEHRYQFIQRHVKKSIRWSITSGSMKPGSVYTDSPKKHEMSRSWTSETDVFVDCCCDLEFQKLTWALIQKRFTGSSSKAVHGFDEVNPTQLRKAMLQSRASTTEGAITRREVIALLEEQRRSLEGKARSWSMAPNSREDGFAPRGSMSLIAPVPSQEEEGDSTADTRQVVPTKRVVVRDIDFDSEHDTHSRKRKQTPMSERRESVRNVLKLLSLRKLNAPAIHSSSSRDLLHRVGISHVSQATPSESVPPNNRDALPSPKRRERESSIHSTTSKQANNQFQFSADQRHEASSGSHIGHGHPLVFPLRHGVAVENAAIQLLSRSHSGGSRTIPLNVRQFAFQQRERVSLLPTSGRAHTPPTRISDGGEFADENNVTDLRSVEAQTDQEATSSQSQAPLADSCDACNEKGPGFVTHADKVVQWVNESSIEAAVQCNFAEKTYRDVASVEDAESLGAEQMLGTFPIFIDLDPLVPQTTPLCGSLAKKKYLQVARFSDQRSRGQSWRRSIERVVDVSPGTHEAITTPMQQVDDAFKDGVATATVVEPLPADSAAIPDVRAAYQARYRSHFTTSATELKPTEPPRKSSLISSGRNSLLGLKEDMERLRTRLTQLEHCADEIDEDFKSSHHQLDRIERDHDNIELASQARFLDSIDDVVVDTDVDCSNTGVPRSSATQSALSRKASKDIHEAKKLIEAIEELVLGGHDSD